MGSSMQPMAWKKSIDDSLKELGFNKCVFEYREERYKQRSDHHMSLC